MGQLCTRPAVDGEQTQAHDISANKKRLVGGTTCSQHARASLGSSGGSGARSGAGGCGVYDSTSSYDESGGSNGSAVCGQAFLQWAQTQAAAEGRALDEFLCAYTIGAASSASSLSAASSSAEGFAGSVLPGAVLPPFEPPDLYQTGPPLPGCEPQRAATARSVARMHGQKDPAIGERVLGGGEGLGMGLKGCVYRARFMLARGPEE